MTMTIPGYKITEKVYESSTIAVYRAYHQQQPVIIKLLQAEYPTLEDITRLRHEYAIAKDLDCEGIVTPYRLEKYHNSFALILEDIGGECLTNKLLSAPLTIEQCLLLAIALSNTLIELHKAGIIHKDIKPSNIIINSETNQVKLTDFGCASLLSSENQAVKNPDLIEGTLAYMSPEQTGRMNRTIDYRTDFYSLGATLYEMLALEPPFVTHDLVELVHCHIAKLPVPLHEVKQIPEVLSHIVLKLLAKNAEDRYQTAAGLKFDLETCLHQWQTSAKIEPFLLGKRDRGNQLLIPQKLYGREPEIATLMTAFDRVAGGRSELMLVTGYSGIGKTSIVNEVHKPMIAARGYFIAGKFDQFKRNIPYAAIIQAFQELIRQLLTESAAQIALWQAKLLEALGSNAQVIIDVIPEVELLIGSQPDVPKLGAAETQNRFNRVFREFLAVFCQPHHPLVMFLDDLQWADSASLKLIELLMTDKNSSYLLMIGAYRDNEVNPAHGLIQTLETVQTAGTVMETITVKPLQIHHVNQLLTDTLNYATDSDQIVPLAELIFNKTQGNPFFLTQILKTLYDEKLLVYEVQSDRWLWDIEHIQAIGITDYNIVELIARTIRKLPPETQNVLKLAACIGNQFNLDILAIINQASSVVTANQLWVALQAGLILPLSTTYKIPLVFDEAEDFKVNEVKIGYRFLHDRVQQAVYSLIPEEVLQATHLKIGQLLLENTTPHQRKDNIFALVNQLNFGIDLLTDLVQKYELASLNLIAGQKAKAATAYSSAVKYLQSGLQLLAAESWESEYELTRDLYTEAVEATYLNTDFEEAERLSEIVLRQVNTALEKVKIYETKIQFYIAQNQMQAAIDVGLQALGLLDVTLSETPPQVKHIKELYHLPMMQSKEKLAALQVLVVLHAPVYIANPALLPQVIFTTVNFCIKEGNSHLAPFAYAYYGLLLCGVFGDIELGYQFGQLALWLLEQLDTREIQCKVEVLLNACIRHWKEPAAQVTATLRQAINTGLDTGDLEYACTAASTWCANITLVGEPLDSVYQQQSSHLGLLRSLKQDFYINYFTIWSQFVWNLKHQVDNPTVLSGELFDETETLPVFQATNNFTSLFAFHLGKSILGYLFKDYTLAIAHAQKALNYQQSATSLMVFAQLPFYYALALLAHYPQMDEQTKQQSLNTVDVHLSQLQNWATYAPMNYQHKYALVAAEKARVLGQVVEAMALYEQAIKNTKQHDYIHEEALAYELAAEFYLGLGMEAIAQIYLLKAHNAYIRWGAAAKIRSLELSYRQLLPTVEPTNLSTNFTTTSGSSNILDFITVIKASQALASEIILDRLLEKLMKIAIENAGAQTGFLILEKDGQLLIEASSSVTNNQIIVRQSIPVYSSDKLPISVINYVARTLKYVVLNDATSEVVFRNDPYIIKYNIQSVLCVPIQAQGHLKGILYLENNLTKGAFTPARLLVLEVLCSQAAISIEIAQLYEAQENYSRILEVKVQERTEQLQQSQSLLYSVLNSSLDGVMAFKSVRDSQGIISDFEWCLVNPAAEQIVGRDRQELIGKNLLSELPGNRTEGLFDLYIQVVETGIPLQKEFYYQHEGIETWFHIFAVKLDDGFAITFRDITERKISEAAIQKANQELQRLAMIDGLTQVANRRRFDEYLSLEWQRLTRESTPLSLILCDVDYFKYYNDTYGHQAGDECLRAVAGAISGAVKRSTDLVARYGGEEFAVILPNTDASGAVKVALTIVEQVEQLKIVHAGSLVSEYVTLSIGISSTIPSTQFSPDVLFAVVDNALYTAKQQGRNCMIMKTLPLAYTFEEPSN